MPRRIMVIGLAALAGMLIIAAGEQLVPEKCLAQPVGVVANEIVVQPHFKLSDGEEFSAGKAFGAHIAGRNDVLVTALHVLGPKLAEITEIRLIDLAGTEEIAKPGAAITKSDPVALAKPNHDLAVDLIAFELPAVYPNAVLWLLPTQCPVGTKVWLLTSCDEKGTWVPGEYPATVSLSQPGAMLIKPDRTLSPKGMAGSPVVDGNGVVVGMVLGGQDNGDLYCVPGNRIMARIQSDLGLKVTADLSPNSGSKAAAPPTGKTMVPQPATKKASPAAPPAAPAEAPLEAKPAAVILSKLVRVTSIMDDTATLDVDGTSVKLKVGEEYKTIKLKSIDGSTIKLLEGGVEYSKTAY